MLALVCECEAADGIGVIVGNIAACPRRDLEDITLQVRGALSCCAGDPMHGVFLLSIEISCKAAGRDHALHAQ